MRRIDTIKALKPIVRSKRLRIEREQVALDRDIEAAYAEMLARVTAHNVAVGAYAARASPVVH